MKKEEVKKLDLGEEHMLKRASLRGITENFMTESTSQDVVLQVLDTFADCRKCNSFTEFTSAVKSGRVLGSPTWSSVSNYKTLCVKCRHEDEFTCRIEKNNLGGFSMQIIWVDKSKSKLH